MVCRTKSTLLIIIAMEMFANEISAFRKINGLCIWWLFGVKYAPWNRIIFGAFHGVNGNSGELLLNIANTFDMIYLMHAIHLSILFICMRKVGIHCVCWTAFYMCGRLMVCGWWVCAWGR